MDIDITHLSNEELMTLNHRIVDLLKRRSDQRASKDLEKFVVGDEVFFVSDDGTRVEGIVTRVNKKTLSIHTDHNGHWRVSPSLAHKIDNKKTSNLVRIH